MKHLLVVAGCLAVVGCQAGAIGGAGPAQPTPSHKTPTSSSAPSGGRGPTVTYQPVRDAAYTIYRQDSLILHLPDGATQKQWLERTAYVHLTVAEEPAGGGYRATIVLDSLRATADGVALPPDSLMLVRGTRWSATLTPAGQLFRLVADRPTTLGEQFASHFRLLFPTLPPGGARAGMEWTDSTHFPLKTDAFDATEQASVTYHAAEDKNAIKLESNGSYKRSGKRMQFNQELDMTASGNRQGVHYLGQDGVLISAEGSDSGEMTITIAAVGQTVPVAQSGRYKIQAIGR